MIGDTKAATSHSEPVRMEQPLECARPPAVPGGRQELSGYETVAWPARVQIALGLPLRIDQGGLAYVEAGRAKGKVVVSLR